MTLGTLIYEALRRGVDVVLMNNHDESSVEIRMRKHGVTRSGKLTRLISFIELKHSPLGGEGLLRETVSQMLQELGINVEDR